MPISLWENATKPAFQRCREKGDDGGVPIPLWGNASESAFQCCREKGEELRAAVEEWQTKRAVPEPRLTTGFLDGIQPIVDSYELKVNSKDSAFVTYIAFENKRVKQKRLLQQVLTKVSLLL